MSPVIRPARKADLPALKKLIARYAREKKLLRRSDAELHAELRDFFVAVAEGANGAGEVVGCVALDVYSRKLAEIRSLAVAPEAKGRDIGSALVAACLRRAKSRGIAEVMAITSAEKFFEKQGFSFALPNEKKALFYWTK